MTKLSFYSIVLLLSFSSISYGQTKLIAHKSHSGAIKNFSVSKYDDNLGLPPSRLEEIVKLNDSTVVLVKSRDFGKRHLETDTVVCGNVDGYVKSVLKYENINEVRLIGFEKPKRDFKTDKKTKKSQGVYAVPHQNTNHPGSLILLYILAGLLISFAWFIWQKNLSKIKSYSS